MASLSVYPSTAERYNVLLDLARSLTSTLEPEALYAVIHGHVSRALPASSFTVLVADAHAGLRSAYHAGSGGGGVHHPAHELERLRAGDYILRASADSQGWLLAAPLAREDRLLGSLVVERGEGTPFDAADANFLLGVAQLASVALDNARLFEEVRRRGEEAERLESIARELAGSLEMGEVVERVAARAHQVIGKPVVLWLIEGSRIRAVARAGGAMIRLGEERVLPANMIARLRAEAVMRPGFATEGGTDGADGGPASASGDARRVLVPLLLGRRLLGLLAIGPWVDDAPDPTQLRLLYRIAPHATSAIENARLHGEVRRLSLTDPLVQLPNRRQLDLFLEKEFAAARRGRPLCFVLYDLDRFKEYNDTHGHRAGDIALIRFAGVLRRETRAMNLAARYGGEEFATVLSGTDLAGGKAHAERVRRAVFEIFQGELSVSAGVAVYESDMATPVDLVVAADRALYHAKMTGRNQVVVAPV